MDFGKEMRKITPFSEPRLQSTQITELQFTTDVCPLAGTFGQPLPPNPHTRPPAMHNPSHKY